MSIEVKNVTYVYMPKTPFERVALADVSLTIPEGSFTAIAGHTGSGKSTLVQHLNGLLTPTSGAVLVDGVNIGDKSKTGRQQAQTARQQVGMVFQYAEHQLFEESIAADIAFGPANQELSAEEIDQRVREAMGIVGLDYDTYHDRSPFSLSGGQMRRAAIAGVLAMRPKYLVLDEPAAGLDPSGREELLQQIKRLHKEQNMTIVMVSHSMEDIAKLADNVIIMAQGKVAAQGTPRDVFAQDNLLRQAGLRPPQIAVMMQRLSAAGLPVNSHVLTPEEGLQSLLEVFHVK
ncbi:MAG: energy-coupling factor transporter ATPase [Selenomonas sp.]|nr:energy-coupling factor transporter ATPase [Selenomonas sp.]